MAEGRGEIERAVIGLTWKEMVKRCEGECSGATLPSVALPLPLCCPLFTPDPGLLGSGADDSLRIYRIRLAFFFLVFFSILLLPVPRFPVLSRPCIILRQHISLSKTTPSFIPTYLIAFFPLTSSCIHVLLMRHSSYPFPSPRLPGHLASL